MKQLIVILLISILGLLTVLFTNDNAYNVNILRTELITGNQVLMELNDKIYKAIKIQVEFYPMYEQYLLKVDTIRNEIALARETKQSPFDEIYPIVKRTNSYDVENLFNSIYKEIPKTTFLNNEIFQAQLSVSETVFLNFFAEKASGSRYCWNAVEFENHHIKNYACLGEKFTGEYLIFQMDRCERSDEDVKITVNGKRIKLEDFKGKFTLKPTKSGKQTYQVTLELNDDNGKLLFFERMFEYWVE